MNLQQRIFIISFISFETTNISCFDILVIPTHLNKNTLLLQTCVRSGREKKSHKTTKALKDMI